MCLIACMYWEKLILRAKGWCCAVLVNLKCSAFRNKDGSQRSLVVFNKGLNIIVGHLGSSGSVGKSTFLMAIDFAFGGDDYITKLRDIIHNYVPKHEFTFTFEFKGEQYHFMRATIESDSVYICNEKHVPNMYETWSIQRFRDWLFDMYELPSDNPMAREHISRFFRIYHRGNFNEKRPLHFQGSDKSEAIDSLLQMMGESSLAYEKDELNRCKEKLNVYKKATTYNFIPNGITADEVVKNKEDIENLQRQITELIDRNPAQLEALNILRDNERMLAALRNKLSFARQRRGQIESEIAVIINNLRFQQDEYFVDAFNDLLEFFPNVNLPLLTKIEEFHVKLSRMLFEEFGEAKNRLEESLAIIESEIEDIEFQITELGKKDKTAETFAQTYSALKFDMARLQSQNDSFKLFLDLEYAVKAQTEKLKLLEEQKREVLQKISEKLTNKMSEINEFICGEKQSSSTIRLNSLSQYTFNTFRDGGTSASFRGLVLFDLAVLSLTKLPALAHDFAILNQVELSHREQIFAYYARLQNKQIFIALDEIETYSNPIKELLKQATVLSLRGEEDVLFGIAWNTKEDEGFNQLTLADVMTLAEE